MDYRDLSPTVREAMQDRERVAHALRLELVLYEDDHGFYYDQASKGECDDFILGVLKKWQDKAVMLGGLDE